MEDHLELPTPQDAASKTRKYEDLAPPNTPILSAPPPAYMGQHVSSPEDDFPPPSHTSGPLFMNIPSDEKHQPSDAAEAEAQAPSPGQSGQRSRCSRLQEHRYGDLRSDRRPMRRRWLLWRIVAWLVALYLTGFVAYIFASWLFGRDARQE